YKGNPVIHGVLGSDKNLPAVTVYNHIDVQPASKESEPWITEPFVMTRKGDTYFGRGTTDDKGPALSALYGARAALDAGVPLNINFLWEFEEEIGSPNFESIISKAAPNLRTDSVVVSDTVWVSRQRPASSAGLRGLLGFLLTLETGTTDTHSGETGGASRNPIAELMRLVCDLYDVTTGKIKILLKSAVKERNPDVRIEFESSAPAFRTHLDGPLPEALKRAIKFAFRRDAVFVRDGGTIGAMTSIEKVLKCPVLFLGLSLPEHGYHAPNENFDWQQASGGMVAFAKYFEEIANLPRA